MMNDELETARLSGSSHATFDLCLDSSVGCYVSDDDVQSPVLGQFIANFEIGSSSRQIGGHDHIAWTQSCVVLLLLEFLVERTDVFDNIALV